MSTVAFDQKVPQYFFFFFIIVSRRYIFADSCFGSVSADAEVSEPPKAHERVLDTSDIQTFRWKSTAMRKAHIHTRTHNFSSPLRTAPRLYKNIYFLFFYILYPLKLDWDKPYGPVRKDLEQANGQIFAPTLLNSKKKKYNKHTAPSTE